MTTFAVIGLIVAILLAAWLLEEIRRHDRTKRALARRDKALDRMLKLLKASGTARAELSGELAAARMQLATHICDDSPKSTVIGLVKPPTE